MTRKDVFDPIFMFSVTYCYWEGLGSPLHWAPLQVTSCHSSIHRWWFDTQQRFGSEEKQPEPESVAA